MPAPIRDFDVDVRDLLRHPGAHKHVCFEEALTGVVMQSATLSTSGRVVVNVEIESVVEGLLVTGEVRAVASFECARCLTPTDVELRAPVQELFALSAARAEEPAYAVTAEERLPLEAMARDAIVLALPAVVVCRPDCAGLCPECGANRNDRDCAHPAETPDPRWAPLQALARTGAVDRDHRS